MKNGIIITITLAVWWLVKMFFKLLKTIVEFLSNVIVFLGLYFPLFYIVFGLILLATTSFTFGGTGTYQLLYYIGLGVCCLASVIISIRNLLVRPISFIFEPFRKYRDEVKSSKKGGRSHENNYDDPDGAEDDYPSERGGRLERGYRGERAYRDERGERYDRDRAPYSRRDEYDDYDRADERYDYSSRPREDGWRDYREMPRDGYDTAPRYEDRRDPYYEGRREEYPYYGDSREEYPYYDDRRDSYDYDDDARRVEQGFRPRVYPREGNYAGAIREPLPERPLIYYSQRRPGVLVKEYSDRFELYREDASGRHHIGTEYKDE